MLHHICSKYSTQSNEHKTISNSKNISLREAIDVYSWSVLISINNLILKVGAKHHTRPGDLKVVGPEYLLFDFKAPPQCTKSISKLAESDENDGETEGKPLSKRKRFGCLTRTEYFQIIRHLFLNGRSDS